MNKHAVLQLILEKLAADLRAAEPKARVTLNANGTALVESDMTDIGTGTYTVMTQIAADAMGAEIRRLRLQVAEFGLSMSDPRGFGPIECSVRLD